MKLCSILIFLLLPFLMTAQDELQSRERTAYRDCYDSLKTHLQNRGIQMDSIELYLRAFKASEELQIWVKNCTDSTFQYLKSYKFCTSSGTLGPKRKKGDKQIPEGFYYIKDFDAESPYYLSLFTNYPNPADATLGDPEDPGSDIQIHGDCISTGCIAITNHFIKELYVLCHKAKQNGQDYIEIHIFPFDFLAMDLDSYIEQHPESKSFYDLWITMEKAVCNFEENKTLPDYRIERSGNYVIIESKP